MQNSITNIIPIDNLIQILEQVLEPYGWILTCVIYLVVQLVVFAKTGKPGWYKRGRVTESMWRQAVRAYYLTHISQIILCLIFLFVEVYVFFTGQNDVSSLVRMILKIKVIKYMMAAGLILTLVGLSGD